MSPTADARIQNFNHLAAEVCQNHEEGCPCDEPGDVKECGRIKRVTGDYVWCSTGHQTCTEDGMWGNCIGDQIADTPSVTQ